MTKVDSSIAGLEESVRLRRIRSPGDLYVLAWLVSIAVFAVVAWSLCQLWGADSHINSVCADYEQQFGDCTPVSPPFEPAIGNPGTPLIEIINAREANANSQREAGARGLLVAAAIVAGYLTFRRTRALELTAKTAQDQLHMDRFPRAMGALGDADKIVRAGGLSALEDLAVARREEYGDSVYRALVNYVVTHSTPPEVTGGQGGEEPDHSTMFVPGDDVRAAIEILSRRRFLFYPNSDRRLDGPVFQNLDLSRSRLAGLKLTNSEFRDINLDGSVITYTNFVRAIITDTHFDKATLNEINFDAAKLTNTSFEDATFFGVIFRDGNLVNTNFLRAKLDHANFIRSTLMDTNFEEATIPNGKFGEATIFDTNFDDALLNVVDFSGTSLHNTTFQSARLPQAKFPRASLLDAVFKHAVLTDANFRDAVLIRVDFQHANLTDADFRDTVLDGVSFLKANLTNANFSDAEWPQGDRPVWPNGMLEGPYSISTFERDGVTWERVSLEAND